MSEPELQLDPAIRLWVFLPIVMITFLIGILRHYVSVLLSSQKKVDLNAVTDSQMLIRSRMLRENGKYLPKQSFLMRKHYFNNEDNGILKAGTQRQTAPPNPMTDPSMMTEMLKGNLTSMVPMVVVGGWINCECEVVTDSHVTRGVYDVLLVPGLRTRNRFQISISLSLP